MPKPPKQPEAQNESGSGAALKRLEDEELLLFKKYKSLEEACNGKQGTFLEDALNEKDEAWKQWQSALKPLLSFDKSVSQEKRVEGQMLPQAMIANYVENLTRQIIVIQEQYIFSVAQEVAKLEKEVDIHLKTSERIREIFRNVINSAITEEKLPAWFRVAVEKAL
jgi:hypothetical protein